MLLFVSSEEEEPDYTVDGVVTFLQSQIDKAVEAGQKIRGPYLAQLELSRYLFSRKLPMPENLGGDLKLCSWSIICPAQVATIKLEKYTVFIRIEAPGAKTNF